MMNKRSKKVFVAMSGGVDSSVAAALLKERGYEVIGVYMKCYNLDGCAEQDAEDARRAAEVLSIPFYVFDFENEYKRSVVQYMIDGYRRGITPNPDVMCNKEIKFGLFFKKALEAGADYIATGHYVRLVNDQEPLTHIKNRDSLTTNYKLYAARDSQKDQSYFLWTLTQKQLRHCLFPIGDYLKSEVRHLAHKFGLPNADKKDSQGICFLGRVSLPDFLRRYIKFRKGQVTTIDGKVLGEHHGAHYYTIGQRHGLGIGGTGQPLYVVAKDVKKNIVMVVEGSDHPALYKKEILLTDVNFIASINNYQSPFTVYTRVRYRQPLARARVLFLSSQAHQYSKQLILQFVRPVKFVAEGQSAVFYTKSGEMLGGGIIQYAR